MKRILVLHGVNADMFQYRNPEYYGGNSLDSVNDAMRDTAKELDIELIIYQSNHAGDIVDKLHEAFFDGTDAIIINPGAFTNCDCGVKEAMALMKIPIVEIHMANLFKKKEGHPSGVTTQVATAVIMGMQLDTYTLAVRAAVALIDRNKK